MNNIIALGNIIDSIFAKLRAPVDFSASLLLRIFLAPIFIKAGYGKLQLGASDVGFFERFTANPSVVAWFGNPEWGLGMPLPGLMAFMAGWTEFLGGWFLVAGLLIRYIAIPLMFTMIIAATTAHWGNGWHALPEGKLMVPWEWRADMIKEANVRKAKAVDVLKQHSNYEWITEYGSVTILKNGIEFSATYFLMLLALVFLGGGRYVSVDYWIAEKLRPE